MIKSLILSELAYINTNHPDFVHIASKISQKIQDNDTSFFFPQSAQMYANNVETALTNDFKTNHDHELGDHFNKREIFDSNLLIVLIRCYLKIIKHKFQDSVPKFITYFLIEKTLDRLPNELIDKLLTDELVNELLTESIDIKNEREINYQMIQALTTAKRLIKEVKETQI
uniref:Dynamin-1-like protein (Trinotate prediction) n=1 Tax=Henneguya salminicola TaxID=69463 RepID=A0A6G3MF11_HENSL